MKVKISSDLEKARAIKKMIQSRKNFVENFKGKVFTTIICENYYEIIKELATALCLSKGFKFIGDYAHKELIEETVKMTGLDDSFLVFLDDLRIRRNGILYYGEQFGDNYLTNNVNKLERVIKKIEESLDKQIGVKDE
jgi:hypothetical protein